MRRKSNPEQQIHKAIIDYLNMFPGKLLAITVKNTGTMREGVYCPSKTTILGISDIIVFPARAWGKVSKIDTEKKMVEFESCGDRTPFFCEVKTPSKTSRQSVNQVGFEKLVSDLGYDYYIWRSITDAENTLKERGII